MITTTTFSPMLFCSSVNDNDMTSTFAFPHLFCHHPQEMSGTVLIAKCDGAMRPVGFVAPVAVRTSTFVGRSVNKRGVGYTSRRRCTRVVVPSASTTVKPERRAVGKEFEADSSGGVRGRWRIVLAAGTVHAVHIAAIYLGPTTLMSPMREELSLSITQIALPLNVFRAVNAIFLIPVGALLDRVGVFRVLWASMVGAAIFGLILPFSNSLLHLTTLQAIFGVSKLFGGLTSMLLVVSAAFGASKAGTAAGVILSGYSLAGCIAPAVIGLLSSNYGWRVAMAVLNGFFLVVGIPLSYKYLRLPFGESLKAKRASRAGGGELGQVGTKEEPLFTRPYAACLAMMAFLSVSIHVVLDHLVIYMREDVGIPFQMCTVYMSILNLVALFAKLGVGWLSDRFDRGALFMASAVLAVVSCFTLLGVTSMGTLALASSNVRLLAFVVLCKLDCMCFACVSNRILTFLCSRYGIFFRVYFDYNSAAEIR